MSTKPQQKPWVNHLGEEVPVKYIDKYTKEKEKAIHKILAKACSVNLSLVEFKETSFKQCDKLWDDMFKNQNIEKNRL
jgi:hypothetical protein